MSSLQNFGTWPIYDMIFFRYMICYGRLVHFCCPALSVWSCERSVANFFSVFLLSLPIICASLSRNYGKRQEEHRKEVESISNRTFTRSDRKSRAAEMNKSAITDHVAKENHVINWSDAVWKEKDIGKPGRSRNRSGSGKNPPAWTEMEGHTAYRQPMTVFWSRVQHQHHVTTSLMKLAVGERNVATNSDIISRLCRRILF